MGISAQFIDKEKVTFSMVCVTDSFPTFFEFNGCIFLPSVL